MERATTTSIVVGILGSLTLNKTVSIEGNNVTGSPNSFE